jgi:hypothetical protein
MSERSSRSRAAQAKDRPEAEEQVPGTGPAFVPAAVEQDAQPKPAPGEVLVSYTGMADRVTYGEHEFRPGHPVAVPREVAESLVQTLSSETFDVEE